MEQRVNEDYRGRDIHLGRLEFLREVEESADPAAAAAAALDDAVLEGMVEEKGEIFMKEMVNRERGGYREDWS